MFAWNHFVKLFHFHYWNWIIPASKVSREVESLTWRKNPYTPVFWPQLSQEWRNRMVWNFWGISLTKSHVPIFFLIRVPLWPNRGLKNQPFDQVFTWIMQAFCFFNKQLGLFFVFFLLLGNWACLISRLPINSLPNVGGPHHWIWHVGGAWV